MVAVLQAILGWIAGAFEWLLSVVLWLPVKLFLMLGDALLWVLEAIPVPDWMTGAALNLSSVSPSMMYFLEPLQFETGLSWVLSALLLRFMVRRLPVIG